VHQQPIWNYRQEDDAPVSSTTAVSTPAPLIRTVLGDVAVGALGPTDYHEHLFQRSPLLPGEDLDDEERSRHEAGMLRASGAAAMVEATPFGVGRRPSAVARISARTGLTVVHVTGAHREAHYPDAPGLTALAVERLHELFVGELTTGMTDPDGAPSLAPDGHLVYAGVLKIGVGYWAFSAFERRVAEAAARCSAETGAPVMVHLEHGSAAHETLDLLAGHECPPERVVLAHIDRNPDPGLLGELASRGAYLGFDGAARHQNWPDSMLIECIRALVEAG